VTDHVSHPYKTTSKIVALYILIFNFFREEAGRYAEKMVASTSRI
jgi:hypothetical protein